ncbi:hypothetical protein TBK1r_10280 [Stieleria magnilauensis]|uniref:Uncharacterized protein n=1 Tax=Stieleria magnilauensis TaxID=2527963 RepID=A0ABX5XJE5_9BACT|nr:hypothetical protein TBK1r_10280 [Planctomycetes bacterium TBK1r]
MVSWLRRNQFAAGKSTRLVARTSPRAQPFVLFTMKFYTVCGMQPQLSGT